VDGSGLAVDDLFCMKAKHKEGKAKHEASGGFCFFSFSSKSICEAKSK